MWISKAAHVAVAAAHSALKDELARVLGEVIKFTAENHRLEIENTRLRSDMDWFKIRLNAVEKERAQLIAAAIGVKIAIPEFVPAAGDAGKMRDAFQEMIDLTTVGGDARDETSLPDQPDYSQMPGYRAGK